MSVTAKLHYKAITELVETMTIAGALAIGVDLAWLVRDSVVDGLTSGRVTIGVGLMMCFTVIMVALVKYHKKQLVEIRRDVMQQKLHTLKKLHKHTKGL